MLEARQGPGSGLVGDAGTPVEPCLPTRIERSADVWTLSLCPLPFHVSAASFPLSQLTGVILLCLRFLEAKFLTTNKSFLSHSDPVGKYCSQLRGQSLHTTRCPEAEPSATLWTASPHVCGQSIQPQLEYPMHSVPQRYITGHIWPLLPIRRCVLDYSVTFLCHLML